MQQTTKGITPSQTVGPFFKYGLTPGNKYDWNDAFTNNLVTPDASGERIRVEGRVFDGIGHISLCHLNELATAGRSRVGGSQLGTQVQEALRG